MLPRGRAPLLAIKAFRFNALDYLFKPIKENELDEAVRRLLKSAGNSMEDRNALSNLESQSVENQKLMLSPQNGTLRLPLKQITHIEGERNYSYIHLSTRSRELSSKNLAHFEDILADKNFFRSHRSFLINRYHVEALKDDHFVLKNGLYKRPAPSRRTARVPSSGGGIHSGFGRRIMWRGLFATK